MFPKDFTKVITMSVGDATVRGMNTDWKATIDDTLRGLIVPKVEVKPGEYFDKTIYNSLRDERTKIFDNECAEEASRFKA
jgi:hypothetical protein